MRFISHPALWHTPQGFLFALNFALREHFECFFTRLRLLKGVTLYERESVIVFDEVQKYPIARQAIKALVEDGRYDYIETGSLISIHKNVEHIIIPSEEEVLEMYPMDYKIIREQRPIAFVSKL